MWHQRVCCIIQTPTQRICWFIYDKIWFSSNVHGLLNGNHKLKLEHIHFVEGANKCYITFIRYAQIQNI